MTTPADFIGAAARAALARYANTVGGITTPGTFLHGSAVQADLVANSNPVPLAVLFDYTTNQKATTARVERADCTLYFADSKLGQGDSEEREAAAVARMNELKQLFFATLDLSPVVEVTNLRATPFHNAYEAELTGVGVQFTLGVPAPALC